MTHAQQRVAALLDATNLLASGKVFAIVGWDRELARAARGLRARVVVAEAGEPAAAEARAEGYEVLPLAEALAQAELVIGDEVDPRLLRDGAVVSGISLAGDDVRAGVTEHRRDDGTSIFVVQSTASAPSV